MKKRITIDPITRLEGHGKIEIFLNDEGNVERAFLQIPELRGFEKFVEGRPAEEMPQITSRICGVCPGAHHIASTKALDDLYKVKPPPAAVAIRKLYYYLHFFEDHLLHFYILAAPDFLTDPSIEKEKRNIFGVIEKLGAETGMKVIEIRKKARMFISEIAGKPIHPVFGLPGGVSKPVTNETQSRLKIFAREAIEFARLTLDIFHDLVLGNTEYRDFINSDMYNNETYYMGMVDADNKVEFYDGDIRVVTPKGKEKLRFRPDEYHRVIAEHIEPWSYIKFPYLREIGWKGFTDGPDSGIYRVAPLARFNVADGMATPAAQEEYEKMAKTFKKKPVHHTLAMHWARLIETLYSAEMIARIADDPELVSREIRNMKLQVPKEGVGIVEAPRGTLIHHYKTDEKGIITGCNLIVASLGNSAAMCMSVERAAKALIHNGKVDDGLLNMVEMAFRAYDPCFGCATHSLPGKLPLIIHIHHRNDTIINTLIRDSNGEVLFL
ncbi:MAG: Ni/Fe hydrogenase subunit alpha [Spirochaetales bacterium]|nr:Ni/Fe hydrogenase subunit alpha [Spirochaetales bacterium]